MTSFVMAPNGDACGSVVRSVDYPIDAEKQCSDTLTERTVWAGFFLVVGCVSLALGGRRFSRLQTWTSEPPPDA